MEETRQDEFSALPCSFRIPVVTSPSSTGGYGSMGSLLKGWNVLFESLGTFTYRPSSKGLEAESKITYVHKLCSRRQAKEMSSETNVCSRRSLELEFRRRGKRRLR
ncbi:hypothetical protein TNIN_66891 [Trichonephila inaurata madagascariensis]|uniref:Uncharacterized protein n=1 Tax=Trichonephila inaurata madagascariensis TaxID=2747483 RepID=A0A8X6WZL1_9ARAC|nr:hypothetical protein TNIN_66891 [Trichonephila inaurata madagascariensis]